MKKIPVILLLLLGLALPVGAQGMKKKLEGYTWKSKVQISLNGEVKSVRVYQVSYDSAGQQQKTELSEQDTPAKSPRGPIRQALAKRIEEKKKAEIEGLQQTLAAYSHLTPADLKKFMDGAQVSTLPQNDPPAIQLTGKGLASPDDDVTLLVSQADKRPLKVTVQTAYQGDPVSIEMDYGQLDGGVPYPEHMVTKVPAQNLEIDVENFDYQKTQK